MKVAHLTALREVDICEVPPGARIASAPRL